MRTSAVLFRGEAAEGLGGGEREVPPELSLGLVVDRRFTMHCCRARIWGFGIERCEDQRSNFKGGATVSVVPLPSSRGTFDRRVSRSL